MANGTSRTLKRVLAGVLTAATLLSFGVASVVRSSQRANAAELYKSLYSREADASTMDSYAQASLGGITYAQFLRGGAAPIVRNSQGSRYAGEIWMDKSVYARYSEGSLPQIRPFESGRAYSASRTVKTLYKYDNSTWQYVDAGEQVPEIDRAVQTLHFWLGLGNINTNARYNIGGISDENELRALLSDGLSDAQAAALNKAVNDAIQDRYTALDDAGKAAFLSDNMDGWWDGETLHLGTNTDGIDAAVSLSDTDSDFLHVFSVLDSSMGKQAVAPVDLVMVLDVSGSMNDYNDVSGNSKIRESINAMNESIDALMKANIYNRVGVVVFASHPAVLMPLGRYEPSDGSADTYESDMYESFRDWPLSPGVYPWSRGGEDTEQGVAAGKYIDVTRSYRYNTASNYWEYTIKAVMPDGEGYTTVRTSGGPGETNGNGYGYGLDSYNNIGSNTNLDAGICTGLDLLAIADNTVQYVDGEPISATPAIIVLGDGDPQFYMENRRSEQVEEEYHARWWDFNLSSIATSQSVGLFNFGSVIFPTVLRAAYMDVMVSRHYEYNAQRLGADTSGTDLNFFSIGIRLGQDDPNHAEYGEKVGTAILNPGGRGSNYGFNKSNNAIGISGGNDEYGQYAVGALKYWEQWMNGESGWYGSLVENGGVASFHSTNNGILRTQYNNAIRFVYARSSYLLRMPTVEETGYEIGTAPILKSDLVNENNLPDYTDAYFGADTAGEASGALLSIVNRLVTPAFDAIGGVNASGENDSVLYVDPIGDYMQIDDVSYITMFGSMYSLDAIGKNMPYAEAAQYLPQSAKTDPGKAALTTYDVYRIKSETGPDGHEIAVINNGNTSAVPDEASIQFGLYRQTDRTSRIRWNTSYAGLDDAAEKMFDLHGDIKIWVEHTGDALDTSSWSGMDEAYSTALFVDVSAKAIPTQVVIVSFTAEEDEGYALGRYVSNMTIEHPERSTPMRIFYTAGLDRQYLSGGADNRMNATGVMTSLMDADYLKENTGTGFRGHDGRYTAFYSNYYTDEAYDGYAIAFDPNKTSRGNAAATFGVGPANQFYRFQKDRPLFLIPGTFGLSERPAEIDFGELSGQNIRIDLASGAVTKDPAAFASGMSFVPMDPTDYSHLLVYLNAVRANLNWDGTGIIGPEGRYNTGSGDFVPDPSATSKYWRFGEVTTVTDRILSREEIHADYDVRKALFPQDEYPELYDDDGEDILHRDLEAAMSAAGVSNGMPEVSGDNWYYIIREAYEPHFQGEETSTEDVSVRYFAIPRKGTELGIDGDEAFVHWYSPDYESWLEAGIGTDGYSEFAFADMSAGVPDGVTVMGGDGKPLYAGQEVHWLLSAMPGGLRTGGLANFAGVKGHDIRAGVSDGSFTANDSGTIDAANITETARTYFLPTIANGVGRGTDVTVNVYLGNNGRVLVPQAMLMISKFVERSDDEGGTRFDVEDRTPFKFEAYIEGFEGTRNAVKIRYDTEMARWRRIVGTISVRVNADGYIIASGRNDNLAEVGYDSSTGRLVNGGTGYLVKLNGHSGSGGLIEGYKYDDVNDTFLRGNRVEYDDSVVFFSDYSGWLEPIGGGVDIAVNKIPLGTLLPDYSLGDETANTVIQSPYALSIQYAYESYEFEDGFTGFMLKSGEGRLFNALENGAGFAVAEIIDTELQDAGWHFVRGSSVSDDGRRFTFIEDIDDETGDISHIVTGDVGNGEVTASFVNSADLTLTLSKTLEAAEGTELTQDDLDTEFMFLLKLDSPGGAAGNAAYTYAVYDDEADEPIREGHLVGGGVRNHRDDDDKYVDIQAERSDPAAWKIGLTAGQDMVVHGLRDGTSWTWTVTEDPVDGYEPAGNEYSQTGTIEATESGNASFVNIKMPADPVVIMSLDAMKKVDALDGFDVSGYEFEFMLEPVAWPEDVDNAPMPSESTVKIAGEGKISFGEMRFSVPGEYTYRISEKAGGDNGFTYDLAPRTISLNVYEAYVDGVYQQKLVIDGLDEGGVYNTGETFTNVHDGSLSVQLWGVKNIESNPAGAAELQPDMFSFKLEALDGAPMPVSGATAMNDADGIFRFGPIVFHSAGTYQYKITEVAGNQTGWEYDGSEYLVEITVHDGVDGTLSCGDGDIKYTKSGTDADSIVFTNVYSAFGDLKVSKIVSGDNADTDREFHFSVILDDESIDGVYGDMEFASGMASFVLKHNESKTATGLPAGVKYAVFEAETDEDGYVTDVDNDTGAIPIDSEIEAAFDNIMQEPGTGSLIVSKTVSGSGGDQLKEFSFTVTLDDTNIDGKYGDMAFENGVAAFKLKHGESMRATGLPADIGYKVVETDFEGYEQRVIGDSGVIQDGGVARARFENIRLLGDLEIIKTVAGDWGERDREFRFTLTLDDKSVNGIYDDLEFKDGVAEFTLKHGEKKTATGLPVGVKYLITEAETAHYETSSTGASGEIPVGDKVTAAFTNTRLTGGFDVNKTVGGSGGERDRLFKFTIKLDDTTINGKFGDVEFSNGTAVINLKHGETASVTGLPAGIKYEITEEDVSDDGYTTSYDGASGVVPDDGMAHARFVNRKDDQVTGDLEVSKTVIGDAASRTKKFTFTIALSDTSINGKYGDMEFMNGVAEIKLAHGESAIATGLPAGIRYSVREEDFDDYNVSYSGANGTIPEADIAYAVFVNARWEEDENKTGDLMVSKIARGGPGGKWSFQVVLDDRSINGRYGDVRFRNGIAEFELGSGEIAIIRGLPVGVRYTVRELDANTNGYTTVSYGTTGRIDAGRIGHAEFINTYESSGIWVYKYVTGTGGESMRKWLFTVTLSDKTVTGDYGGMHFENGIAQFYLRDGESNYASGLPAGIGYTVIEADANKDGYKTTSTNESGILPAGDMVTVRFTNHRNVDLPGKPTPPPTPDNPNTGDGRPWGFLILLLLLCGFGLPIVLWKSRDRRKAVRPAGAGGTGGTGGVGKRPGTQSHHIVKHTRSRRSK